jgi:acetyltransferase-like isoleucine patch superfamily enzyme
VRVVAGGTVAARMAGVAVGTGCRLYVESFGSEPWLIEIGNNVTISAGVKLITHDGSGWLVGDKYGRRYRYAKISIGDDVFIGMDAIILPGVSVGANCVVGAGAVVARSVPSGSVVAGNPARIIKSFTDFERYAVENWAKSTDMCGDSYKTRTISVAASASRAELQR